MSLMMARRRQQTVLAKKTKEALKTKAESAVENFGDLAVQHMDGASIEDAMEPKKRTKRSKH